MDDDVQATDLSLCFRISDGHMLLGMGDHTRRNSDFSMQAA